MMRRAADLGVRVLFFVGVLVALLLYRSCTIVRDIGVGVGAMTLAGPATAASPQRARIKGEWKI